MRNGATTLAALSAVVILVAIPARAEAGALDVLDLKLEAGLGGPIGLLGADYPGGVTTSPFTLKVAGRVGLPSYTPVSLELSAVVPHGVGFNFRLEVFQALDRLSIHLFDLGLFFNLGEPVSVSRIKRGVDVTAGGGFDIRVWRELEIGLDYRWFFPDPINVIMDYGSFAYPAYKEALRGGQLWLTVGYTW